MLNDENVEGIAIRLFIEVLQYILLHYASLVAAITIVVTSNAADILLAVYIMCGFLIRMYNIIVTWRSSIDIDTDDVNGDVLVGIGVTG